MRSLFHKLTDGRSSIYELTVKRSAYQDMFDVSAIACLI